MVYYGGGDGSMHASFMLECLPSEKQIEFEEFDVEKPSNMAGRISVGGDQGYDFSGLFIEDDVGAYFAFMVPIDHELWTELKKGRSDLTVSVDGAQSYDLPKATVLSDFVSKCRAKV